MRVIRRKCSARSKSQLIAPKFVQSSYPLNFRPYSHFRTTRQPMMSCIRKRSKSARSVRRSASFQLPWNTRLYLPLKRRNSSACSLRLRESWPKKLTRRMATTFYQVVNNKLVQMRTSWRKAAQSCQLNHLHLSGTKKCQRQSCILVKSRSMQISLLLAAFNSPSTRKLQKSAWHKRKRRHNSSSSFKSLKSLQQENSLQEPWTEFSLQTALMEVKTSLCTKP